MTLMRVSVKEEVGLVKNRFCLVLVIASTLFFSSLASQFPTEHYYLTGFGEVLSLDPVFDYCNHFLRTALVQPEFH